MTYGILNTHLSSKTAIPSTTRLTAENFQKGSSTLGVFTSPQTMTDVVAEELGRPIPVMDSGVSANREGSIGYPGNEEGEAMMGKEEGDDAPSSDCVSQQKADDSKEQQQIAICFSLCRWYVVVQKIWLHSISVACECKVIKHVQTYLMRLFPFVAPLLTERGRRAFQPFVPFGPGSCPLASAFFPGSTPTTKAILVRFGGLLFRLSHSFGKDET